jgi:DNA-binding MarR family transcriptional regulator
MTADSLDVPPPRTEDLAEAVIGLSRRVLHLFAEAGRRHKLSQQQVELVCVLIHGPSGMGDLGRRLQLEKSNLSNLVDRMEQRGLVVRTRDPDDRRATWVALTDDGMAAAVRVHDDLTAELGRLLSRVSPDDQRQLAVVARALTGDQPG